MEGAVLMEFSVSAMYKDGIAYYPGLPDLPGSIPGVFVYKFGEDGPAVEPWQLMLGVAASTCQRRRKFDVARARLG